MGKLRFTDEFKINAIKQITERGYSVAGASKRPSAQLSLRNVNLKFEEFTTEVKFLSFALPTVADFQGETQVRGYCQADTLLTFI